MFDIDFVRAQFPALDASWALFDNAGGTVLPDQVISRATAYMRRYQVQLGASYPLSVQAGEAVQAGREAMAEWFNAGPDEIILGASTTTNLRLLATALRPLWQPGDEVVVTDLDHAANLSPWLDLEESGIVIRQWSLRPETASLELADLEDLLNERTRLVCFTHCSNVVGVVHDVAAYVERIHRAGALVCVDGVGFAPHRRVDVKALDVDFYGLSLYKAFGPHQGLLYGKRELLAKARQQNHDFVGGKLPIKMEPGNPNYELTASMLGIFDYFDAVESRHVATGHFASVLDERGARLERIFKLFGDYEDKLSRPLLDFLRQHARVHLVGPDRQEDGSRLPIITFTVEGLLSSQVVSFLDQRQVAVRFGHFYAPRAIRALDLESSEGVVRVSMAHYNHADEVQNLLAGLDELLAG